MKKVENKVADVIKAESLKVNKIIKKVDDLNKKIKKESEEMIGESMQGIFDAFEGRLNKVVIVGYTPSWNDGDACTHSQNIYLSKEDEEDNTCEEDIKDYKNSLSDDEADKLMVYLDKMEDIFNRVFDTNWRLIFSLGKENKVSIKLLPDYDCGY